MPKNKRLSDYCDRHQFTAEERSEFYRYMLDRYSEYVYPEVAIELLKDAEYDEKYRAMKGGYNA